MSVETAPSGTNETAYEALCERARGTNLNDTTLLSTDYFNHFNEVIMLIGMVPDMPEIMEDVREWQPVTYVEHFEGSSISDRDLAIEAFPHVPARFREPFDTTISQMDEVVAEAKETIERLLEAGDDNALRETAEGYSRALQRLVDVAGAIVHGGENIVGQSEIDAIIES
ncbi:MAG: hypothetical protein RIC16_14605 [Rhodospirillales bacterium]